MGFAEAWRKVQKAENVQHEALSKPSKPPFDSFDSNPKGHVSERQAPIDPAPRTHEAEVGDWYDDMISMAIDDLADVRMMEYPEHVRDKARALFDEFSEAAAQGDDARFCAALMEWRQTWLKSMH